MTAPPTFPALLSDPEAGGALAHRLTLAGGVLRGDEPGGQFYAGTWDTVLQALADPVFQRERPDHPVPDLPGGRRPSAGLTEMDQTWAVFRDPPAHGPLRRALAMSLAGLPDAAMRGRIADRLSARIAALRDGGAFDAAQEIAPLVPAVIMAALLGFEGEEARQVEALSRTMLAPDTAGPGFVRARIALVGLLADRLATVGGAPEGDLLARLRAQMPGASVPQVLTAAVFLVTTGHGGLRDALSAGIWLAATGRDGGAIPAMISAGQDLDPAFHETLRLYPPLRMIDRWVAGDCRLGQVRLRRGERLYLLLGAASRDAGRFSVPDRFLPGRQPSRGIAFGAGAHACLGQALSGWAWGLVLRDLFRGGRPPRCTTGAQWSGAADESRLLSVPLQV